MLSKIIPLGKTPVSNSSSASRRNPIFLNETGGELKDCGLYKAEISCSSNNPVFSAVYMHRKWNNEHAGFFVTHGFHGSDAIGLGDTIYVRVVSGYTEK